MRYDIVETLTTVGYCLLPGFFSDVEVIQLQHECKTALENANGSKLESRGLTYGARNLLSIWPGVSELAKQVYFNTQLDEVLGMHAGVVRGLYFDKPPGCSWALPWHRDVNIAVQEHRSSTTFSKPTIKSGVPHVEAPVELLACMVTIRIHLDDMTEANGVLRVVPGSHHLNRPANQDAVAVNCRAGDVLLMRPLLLHSSGHAEPNAGHRRVIHLECASMYELPDDFQWYSYIPLYTSTM